MSKDAGNSNDRGTARALPRRILEFAARLILILFLLAGASYWGTQYAARRLVVSALLDLGCAEASVGSLRVGLGTARLRGLVCRDEQGRALRLEQATLTYPLALPPKLESVGIDVDGLSAHIRQTHDGWALDGLPLPQGGTDAGAFTIPEFPVAGVHLRDATLTVSSARFGTHRVGLNGRVLAPSADALSAAGTLIVDGQFITARVTADRAEGTVRARARTRALHLPPGTFPTDDTSITAGDVRVAGDFRLPTADSPPAWSCAVTIGTAQARLRTPQREIQLVLQSLQARAESAPGHAEAVITLHTAGVDVLGGPMPLRIGSLRIRDMAVPIPGAPATDAPAHPGQRTVGRGQVEGLVLGTSAVAPWSFEINEDADGWTVGVPELMIRTHPWLRVADCELRIPHAGAGVWQFRCEPVVRAREVAGDGAASHGIELPAEVRAVVDSRAEVGEDAEGSPTIQNVGVDLQVESVRPVWRGAALPLSARASIHLRPKAEKWTVAGSAKVEIGAVQSDWIETEGPTIVVAEMTPLSAPLRAWLDCLRSLEGPPGEIPLEVRAQASVQGVHLPPANLHVQGLEATAPLRWVGGSDLRSPEAAPARLSVEGLRWQDLPVRLAPLAVHVRDRAVEGAVAASCGTDEANPLASADGRLYARWGEAPVVDAKVNLRSSQLDDLRRLLERAVDVDISSVAALSGDLAASLHARQEGRGPLSAEAKIDLADVRIETEEPEIIVNGLSGTITMSDLPALRTAPHQRLRFDSALLGSIPVDGGAVDFQIEGPDRFFLERCELRWCGGIVTTHALLFRPSKPSLDLTLFVDGVQLGELFELQTLVKGEAEGRLYGQLPLRYADGDFNFENGYLYSPPGTTGRLLLKEADALLSGLPKETPRIKVVKQTLKDMEYEYIRLDIDTHETMTPLKISVMGHAYDDPTLAPVKLNANIESNINDLLDMTRIMKRLNLSP